MTSASETVFVSTKEHRRFVEFCDACLKYRYIGLCYGPPGVGKTLSAERYTNWEAVAKYRPYAQPDEPVPSELLHCHSVLYSPSVVNTPGQINREIEILRTKLRDLHIREVRRINRPENEEPKQLQWEFRNPRTNLLGWPFLDPIPYPAPHEFSSDLRLKCDAVADPTALIVIDEADRLRISGLEQLRAVFDRGGVGLVLIGMPGIEKRLARYPQLYSRVGFVHEFRPLSQAEIRSLLQTQWHPAGVSLPIDALRDEESLAAILRITRGNFRLLYRLLTQVSRVLEINTLDQVTLEVIEAARESLVIGAD